MPISESKTSASEVEYALTFPGDHPAIRNPSAQRQPANGVAVDGSSHTITLAPDGWIDGPVQIGAGWTLLGVRKVLER